jgi:hypothetical protein
MSLLATCIHRQYTFNRVFLTRTLSRHKFIMSGVLLEGVHRMTPQLDGTGACKR